MSFSRESRAVTDIVDGSVREVTVRMKIERSAVLIEELVKMADL
jgi:hypothetical protein